jgi:hypothetical protein
VNAQCHELPGEWNESFLLQQICLKIRLKLLHNQHTVQFFCLLHFTV